MEEKKWLNVRNVEKKLLTTPRNGIWLVALTNWAKRLG
jgi:hypothetical protein